MGEKWIPGTMEGRKAKLQRKGRETETEREEHTVECTENISPRAIGWENMKS